jgi:hypothetical protein
MQIDVYATVASTLGVETIISTLAVSGVAADSSTTIHADADGVTTVLEDGVTGQTITGGSGSISAVLDGSTPVSAIVDDSGTLTTAAFKFTATNDSYTVTDITLTLANATAVSNVVLREAGETTAIASKPAVTASDMVFSGLSIPVAANGSTVVEVDLEMSSVGTGAGVTGSSLLTTMTAATAKNSQGTSVAGNVTELDPAGNVMYVYKAIPTITPQTLPSTLLIAGGSVQTLSKFTISSNGGPIGWQQVTFTIAKSITGALTLPVLYDVTGGGNGTLVTTTGSYFTDSVEEAAAATGGLVIIPTTEQVVNGSKTYELRMVVAGTPTTGQSITTNIAAVSSYDTGKTAFAYYTPVAGTTVLVHDLAVGGTISTGDIRETANVSVTSAYVQSVGTGVLLALSETTDEVLSYGTVTSLQDIILTETAVDSAIIGTITGSLVATGGFTCLTYDAAGGSVGNSATTTISAIKSIECVNTTTNSLVVLNTQLVAENAGVAQETTVTLTTDTYAIGSSVAATDSDLGIILTAGVPAAASFIWSDQSTAAHANTTADWASDVLVRNIATNTQSLSK